MQAHTAKWVMVAALLCPLGAGLEQARGAIFVSTRVALGESDYIDWGTLGADFTSVANPVTVTSHTSNSTLITKTTAGTMQMRTQGTALGKWVGDFAAGDRVLYTLGTAGPLTLQFSALVGGVGLQIQAATDDGNTFTGTITAYDSVGTVLFTHAVNQVSTSNQDNTALFLGVRSDSVNIKKVTVAVSEPNDINDFAVNRVSLTNLVPEPASLALLAGAGGLLLVRRRARE
jgi:hypothetical protein